MSELPVLVSMEGGIDEDGILALTVSLPTGDLIPVNAPASRVLFQLDRQAYIEALNAARSAPPAPVEAEA